MEYLEMKDREIDILRRENRNLKLSLFERDKKI